MLKIGSDMEQMGYSCFAIGVVSSQRHTPLGFYWRFTEDKALECS
jgi:hypothetical protein